MNWKKAIDEQMKLGIPKDSTFYKINKLPDYNILSKNGNVKPNTPWQWYITQQKVMSNRNDLDPDFLFTNGLWKGRYFELASTENVKSKKKPKSAVVNVV